MISCRIEAGFYREPVKHTQTDQKQMLYSLVCIDTKAAEMLLCWALYVWHYAGCMHNKSQLCGRQINFSRLINYVAYSTCSVR